MKKLTITQFLENRIHEFIITSWNLKGMAVSSWLAWRELEAILQNQKQLQMQCAISTIVL